MYSEDAIRRLRERTEYEAWLLENVYRINNRHSASDHGDAMVYSVSGGPPKITTFGFSSIILGDWRPGFLQAATPLVLVTSFKLLDMVLEWVLELNGRTPTFRFEQKLEALRKRLIFPPLIEQRPWLRIGLIALYERLEPLRGTIIHDRHFDSVSGDLVVSGSKKGLVSPPVTLTATDLQHIARLAVSATRFISGEWKFWDYTEKCVRFLLDEVQHVHHAPLLNQREPSFLNVRLYRPMAEEQVIDLRPVFADTAKRWPNQDVLFDIRLVEVHCAASTACASLIPWSSHRGEQSTLRIGRSELDAMRCTLPDDLNIQELRVALGAGE